MDLDRAIHVDLDGAWPNEPLGLTKVDARVWGPRLRFSAPSRLVEKFYGEIQPRLAPFILYGSGDFHYLTALWARRVQQPFTLVSFDNHPDWAITPPRWAAGSWVNRALELPHVQRVSVWGCGNFECWWPWQILGNRRAERAGKIAVHPWADDRSVQDRHRRGAITREDWRGKFEEFVRQNRDENFYVTIDLDCLRADEARTNWENGRFAIVDLIWALEKLRGSARIIGGDICGAYSPPSYARRRQQLAARLDHPKLPSRSAEETRRINFQTLAQLWPVLTA
jgi:hypothetical protein